MHRHTALGQWAVELLKGTATPPDGWMDRWAIFRPPIPAPTIHKHSPTELTSTNKLGRGGVWIPVPPSAPASTAAAAPWV